MKFTIGEISLKKKMQPTGLDFLRMLYYRQKYRNE